MGDGDDLPVFVAEALVEQALARVRQAGAMETAGILLGRLHRDPGGIIFLELTAQLPASGTEAREMKVTFTPDTWAAARDALRLRQSDEAVMGWWHSHPYWCKACSCAQQAFVRAGTGRDFLQRGRLRICIRAMCFTRPGKSDCFSATVRRGLFRRFFPGGAGWSSLVPFFSWPSQAVSPQPVAPALPSRLRALRRTTTFSNHRRRRTCRQPHARSATTASRLRC